MADVERDEGPDPLQRRPGRRLDSLEVPQPLLVDVLEDLEQEVFLRGDVVVEAAFEDPHRVGDVLNRRRLVALRVEDARGGLEDLLAAASWRPRAPRSSASLSAPRCPRRSPPVRPSPPAVSSCTPGHTAKQPRGVPAPHVNRPFDCLNPSRAAGPHCAVWPPSTWMTVPVTKAEAGEARYATAPSGRRGRRSAAAGSRRAAAPRGARASPARGRTGTSRGRSRSPRSRTGPT